MEHCQRSVAGQRRPQMFQVVDRRRFLHALEYRNPPVVVHLPSHHAAKRPPITVRPGLIGHHDAQRAAPPFGQVKPVTRHPAGEPGPHGRGTRLEIGPGAGNRVRKDHGARIAPTQVFAEPGRVHGLIVDAGVARKRAHRCQRIHDAALFDHLLLFLSHLPPEREIHTPGIGGDRDPETSAPRRCFFQKTKPRIRKRLDIGHHVHGSYRHEVSRTKERPNLHLLRQGLPCRFAHLSGQHRLLFLC